MYRIFCESYNNYIAQYHSKEHQNEYRYKIVKPLGLLGNIHKYFAAKKANTLEYQQLSDLIVYMEKYVEKYPKFKAFLWTLESRGIKGKYFGIASKEELEEQAKLVNMFLSLLYWEKAEEDYLA